MPKSTGDTISLVLFGMLMHKRWTVNLLPGSLTAPRLKMANMFGPEPADKIFRLVRYNKRIGFSLL